MTSLGGAAAARFVLEVSRICTVKLWHEYQWMSDWAYEWMTRLAGTGSQAGRSPLLQSRAFQIDALEMSLSAWCHLTIDATATTATGKLCLHSA
jgi:hypothetical protein